MSTPESRLVADRYRLLRPLGEGGMGRVWLAHDEVLHRDVAIKELVAPAGLPPAERRELRARSLREARAVARLDHPHVVRVFDVVTVGDGDPWIVMEYLPGKSMHEAMADGLPEDQVTRIGWEVLQALQAAHRRGIVHRDVKPSNILLAGDGRAVLTDFGIASVLDDPYVTPTGLLLGSPAYLAPERAREGTTTAESDLWSLGATLFAATEGKPPFARATAIETLTALATEPVPRPERSGALTPVLVGLLQKDPAERMAVGTARRMLRQLLPPPGRTSAPSSAAGSETARTSVPGTRVLPVPQSASTEAPPSEALTAEPSGSDSTAPESSAPTTAVRPSRRRHWRLAAVAAVVVVGVLALVVVDQADQPVGGPSPEPSPPVDGQAATPVPESPGTPTPSPPAGGGAPGQAPEATPDEFELPDGWQMRDDGTGFRVPVPDQWEFGRDQDGRALWQDPATGRLLLIDQTREPRPDPLQDWQNNEQARQDGYAEYQRIRLEEVSYWDSAADWEFTYTLDGTPVRVLNRNVITAPDQAYSIYWRTPADTWDDHHDDLQVVLDGFVPARS